MLAALPLRRTINWKLGRLVAVAVGIALSVSVGLGLWLEAQRYALAKRESLLATAQIFATATADAVAARDHHAAALDLRAIRRVPNVLHAEVLDGEGGWLAESGSAVRLSDELDLQSGDSISLRALLSTRTVRVSVPVIRAGEEVGTLRLVADTSDLWPRLKVVLLTAMAGGLLALIVGLVISVRLQRSITRPLVDLTRIMAGVRENHDYRASAPIVSDDEIGVLATSFNEMIGEIRERDARLARHRANLENEVAERTRDLEVARDAAEAANHAKSDFLATMSHEIRTPMNGMLVMAELLAGADLPERQRRYADVIARSGQSLLAIINDILDFSKIEAGKLELETIPVALTEVVETVVTLFGERAQGKGLDLAGYVAPDVPATIPGDPVRLTQVVSNLVNNALKFTENGHVLIEVRNLRGVLEVSVEDSGIGIPADKRDTIFSAFSQADQSTTRRFGGTGLGLSICKRLIDAMGGEIRVESEVGRGSRFIVTLPLGDDNAVTVPAAQEMRAVLRVTGEATRRALRDGLAAHGIMPGAEGEAAHWFIDAATLMAAGRPRGALQVVALEVMGTRDGDRALEAGLADALLRRPLSPTESRRVLGALATGAALSVPTARQSQTRARRRFAHLRALVADDGAVNREVACEALSRLGIAAETVEDGEAAVEAALSGRFDLVLMDGSMPGLDGFSATRRIRDRESQEGRAPLVILAFTAHVVGTAAEAWREAGMNGVLHKPFTLDKLVEAVRAHCPGTEDEDPGDAGAMDPFPAAAAPTGREIGLLDEEAVAGLVEMAALSGQGFLDRVIGLYRQHAPASLKLLREATGRGEAEDAAKAAHSLKSMSANIGAARLRVRLGDIESASRQGLLPASADLDALERLLEDTLAALDERLPALTRASAADSAAKAARA